MALENKPVYFPKDKDLFTKKYITNEEKVYEHGSLFLEIIDARNIHLCRNSKVREICEKKNKKIHIVLTKIDTISQKQLAKIKAELEERK